MYETQSPEMSGSSPRTNLNIGSSGGGKYHASESASVSITAPGAGARAAAVGTDDVAADRPSHWQRAKPNRPLLTQQQQKRKLSSKGTAERVMAQSHTTSSGLCSGHQQRSVPASSCKAPIGSNGAEVGRAGIRRPGAPVSSRVATSNRTTSKTPMVKPLPSFTPSQAQTQSLSQLSFKPSWMSSSSSTSQALPSSSSSSSGLTAFTGAAALGSGAGSGGGEEIEDGDGLETGTRPASTGHSVGDTTAIFGTSPQFPRSPVSPIVSGRRMWEPDSGGGSGHRGRFAGSSSSTHRPSKAKPGTLKAKLHRVFRDSDANENRVISMPSSSVEAGDPPATGLHEYYNPTESKMAPHSSNPCRSTSGTSSGGSGPNQLQGVRGTLVDLQDPRSRAAHMTDAKIEYVLPDQYPFKVAVLQVIVVWRKKPAAAAAAGGLNTAGKAGPDPNGDAKSSDRMGSSAGEVDMDADITGSRVLLFGEEAPPHEQQHTQQQQHMQQQCERREGNEQATNYAASANFDVAQSTEVAARAPHISSGTTDPTEPAELTLKRGCRVLAFFKHNTCVGQGRDLLQSRHIRIYEPLVFKATECGAALYFRAGLRQAALGSTRAAAISEELDGGYCDDGSGGGDIGCGDSGIDSADAADLSHGVVSGSDTPLVMVCTNLWEGLCG